MVAARLANLGHGQRADYLETDRQISRSVTQPAAAEMLNVGERSVRSARQVLDEGVPELIEAVESGGPDHGADAGTVWQSVRRLPRVSTPAGKTGDKTESHTVVICIYYQ